MNQHQVEVSGGAIGRNFKGLIDRFQGLIELAGLVVGVTQALVRLAVPGKAVDGSLIIGNGGVVIFEGGVGFAAEVVNVGVVVYVKRDCLIKGFQRLGRCRFR